MLNKIFFIKRHHLAADIFLLISRLLVGYAMAMHGSVKIGDPLHWMGPESSFPAVFQFLAAVSEFVGGIALMLGLLTRVAGFGIACTMVVAAWMHCFELGDPFVNMKGGGSYEMPVLLLLLATMFITFGPGRFSVDYLIGSAMRPETPGNDLA